MEPIKRPVFIVGINRTGTTMLHRLMSRDRRFWTIRGYEYAEPVLSTGKYDTVAGTSDAPRRARVQEALGEFGIFDVFKGIHYIDLDEPDEDFPLLMLGFSNWITLFGTICPHSRAA